MATRKRLDSFRHVDKKFLSKYVSKKLNRSIPIYHISAVISFLFDEMITELKNGVTIAIGRFGKFFIKQMRDRSHHDLVEKKFKITKGGKILRFKLNKDIHKILTNNLDIAKTFKGR